MDMNNLKNIKLTVWFFPKGFENSMESSHQQKTFKDLESLVIWCRNNYKKIGALNDYRTFGEPISHFVIMAALDGKAF